MADQMSELPTLAAIAWHVGKRSRGLESLLFQAQSVSVFAASFDIPGACHLCADDIVADDFLLDVLSALVEKSILIGAFTRNPAQIDKNADMPSDFVQRRSLLFACFLRHGRYS